MKELQNNFTTPEQSKRLLELGVPADSADCVLRRVVEDGGYSEYWRKSIFDFIGDIHDDYLPCWSVGRLVEIFLICTPFTEIRLRSRGHCIDRLMASYEDVYEQGLIDFSKLEE